MNKKIFWGIIFLLVISLLYSTIIIQKNYFEGEAQILRNHQYTDEIRDYIRSMKVLFIPFLIFDFLMLGVIIADIIKNVFATDMARTIFKNVLITISKVLVIFAVSLSFSETMSAQNDLINTGHILITGVGIIYPVALTVGLFFISRLFTDMMDRERVNV